MTPVNVDSSKVSHYPAAHPGPVSPTKYAQRGAA